MPVAAPAASAGVEMQAGTFSVGVRGTAWPAVTDGIASGLRVRFDGLGGALHGCALAALSAFGVSLCASARGAALRGRSQGALEEGSDTAPWWALGATAGVTYPRAGALRVRAEAGVALSLDRARFAIEGVGDVHRVPLLAPDLGLLLLITP
jgi:hypothetical protein